MTEYYKPNEIRYTRNHCLWLLHNLVELRNGQRWLVDPHQAESTSQPNPSSNANFVAAIEFVAEITERLEHCGRDGLILLAMECYGESEYSLSKYMGIPAWSVLKRSKSALSYVASGMNRRWHDVKNKDGTMKRKGETYAEFKDKKRRKR